MQVVPERGNEAVPEGRTMLQAFLRDRKAKLPARPARTRSKGKQEDELSGRDRLGAGGGPWNPPLGGTEQRKCVRKSHQPAETRRHQPAYTGKNDRGVVLQINSPRNLRPARGH